MDIKAAMRKSQVMWMGPSRSIGSRWFKRFMFQTRTFDLAWGEGCLFGKAVEEAFHEGQGLSDTEILEALPKPLKNMPKKRAFRKQYLAGFRSGYRFLRNHSEVKVPYTYETLINLVR